MEPRIEDGLRALTEREKQTLRLIVRGHDAKSTARGLGLSVHTINERLREARRKMAVSSSREAARLLLAAEGGTPESRVPEQMGEDEASVSMEEEAPPVVGGRRFARRLHIAIGGLLMTLLLGLLALAGANLAPAPIDGDPTQPEVVEAARQWLTLVDQGRWDDSYRATGAAFRKLNTAKVWADVSTRVRTPLGAMQSRTLLSQENLPAPPAGYEVVKFRTSFANKADATETVTLEHEMAGWRVVGVTIG